jgi:hypothetical protein
MRKYSLLLAVMLAASFSTVADAAKKKAGGVAPDAVHEWNAKNIPPMPMPGASAATAAPAKAAKPAKKSKKAKKSSKKKAKKA